LVVVAKLFALDKLTCGIVESDSFKVAGFFSFVVPPLAGLAIEGSFMIFLYGSNALVVI